MISIIICSRKNAIPEELSKNIDATIGCKYELIIIGNSENKYSIFEAYNIGIEKSKGEYLCFIHDDILFHTQNWGNVVTQIFRENPKAGLLGIAGSKVKTQMPSGWWSCPPEFKEINIIQHFLDKKKEKWEFGFNKGSFSEVVAIDGVFMVIKKDSNLFFNEKMQGFHNYDLNISFECKKRGLKIFVTNKVLIEHYSNGEINDSWYESTYNAHHIYKGQLPLMTSDVKNYNILDLEFRNGMAFLNPFIRIGHIKGIIIIWLKLLSMKQKEVFQLKFLKSIVKRCF